MVALAVVVSVVVLLMAVLVAGLLRSHADILRALHELGVGVGEPGGDRSRDQGPTGVPVTMGPPLPGERSSTSARSVAGVTPDGDALAVSPGGAGHATLLAFLSSGCATCAGFWRSFEQPDRLGLPPGTRLIVITKGPELEVPAEVTGKAHRGLTVIMSTEAWVDYEVPGAPFFVLVDGRSGRRIGEGVANHFPQVVEMVHRAAADADGFTATTTSRPFADGLDGPEREAANDRELLAAGIHPGDPSLYPRSLDDIHGAVTVDRSGGHPGASRPARRAG
ncbi:MAG TPA: hypothetical protein VG032_03335 [Acidimicrobiales bacterium]|jgi:hypothetical protein|nr:hypothetical protein [Acidimicrobiales bacterium]